MSRSALTLGARSAAFKAPLALAQRPRAPAGCRRREERPTRMVVLARAEGEDKKDVGGAEADEFLGGALGKFISGLTEFAANSPINQGKIALAKAQAGDYDVAATRAELQEIIDGSKVVMFSFTT
uniref:Uncharacterized protein n=1 Tax=Chloropicon laureae TaxID=464258 RepID=A0A7S3E1N2_9CHLO|mmetsp:Transcript_12795/g.33121  ORF Transcript_12795/g.33121 Transcript_12795/m.33121 type:complete len:125 (+) Transcript_12795:3-377(+)